MQLFLSGIVKRDVAVWFKYFSILKQQFRVTGIFLWTQTYAQTQGGFKGYPWVGLIVGYLEHLVGIVTSSGQITNACIVLVLHFTYDFSPLGMIRTKCDEFPEDTHRTECGYDADHGSSHCN